LHEGDKTLVVMSFQIVNFQYIIGFRASTEVDNWAGEYPWGIIFFPNLKISNKVSLKTTFHLRFPIQPQKR
jgi:hypothetical protein